MVTTEKRLSFKSDLKFTDVNKNSLYKNPRWAKHRFLMILDGNFSCISSWKIHLLSYKNIFIYNLILVYCKDLERTWKKQY